MCDSAGKESTYSAGDLGLIPGLGRSPRASLVAQMVESACNAGDPGLIPGSGRSPEGGNSSLLQCPYLGNPMDKEAWWVGYRTYLFP